MGNLCCTDDSKNNEGITFALIMAIKYRNLRMVRENLNFDFNTEYDGLSILHYLVIYSINYPYNELVQLCNIFRPYLYRFDWVFNLNSTTNNSLKIDYSISNSFGTLGELILKPLIDPNRNNNDRFIISINKDYNIQSNIIIKLNGVNPTILAQSIKSLLNDDYVSRNINLVSSLLK